MESFNLDKETAKLANRLRDVLGEHMLKFHSLESKEIVTTCLIALAIEVGRLKWLGVCTEGVDANNFDRIFSKAVEVHYKENEKRYGLN